MEEHRNSVEFVGHYGGDETHALSAWTSTSRDLTEDKRSRIAALLDQLAKAGHGTPFEKSAIHFLVTTDVATHIQLIKHRIAVPINAESARYKELRDDKFYVPTDWDADDRATFIEHMETSLREYHACLARLVSKGVPRKRAKESARYYLPYGNQITADVMFNFRSFMHFVGLRYSSHAQLEIREIARQMLEQVLATHAFDHSLAAFGYLDEAGNLMGPLT